MFRPDQRLGLCWCCCSGRTVLHPGFRPERRNWYSSYPYRCPDCRWNCFHQSYCCRMSCCRCWFRCCYRRFRYCYHRQKSAPLLMLPDRWTAQLPQELSSFCLFPHLYPTKCEHPVRDNVPTAHLTRATGCCVGTCRLLDCLRSPSDKNRPIM